MSVVVPACDDEADFLDEGLASLRARPQTALELIVVPHGVCDLIPALADRNAAEDPRVQVLEPVPGSHNEAFDVGARSASGSYLAFAKASDLVPVGGLRRLVLSLEESGSDFALGQLTENVLAPDVAEMARQLTLPPVRRARLADLPSAITQTHPGNRVFRATFWRKEGLAFSEAGSKVNRDPIVEAYLRARAFDVVDEVTYRSMNRGLGTPIGHQHDSMAELPEWLDRQRETMELLRDADDEVRTAWVVGVLERDVARFCEDAERADEGRWADLRAHARSLVEFGGDGVSGRLSSDTSVRTWLLLHDKRTNLEQLSLLRRFTNGHRRTEVHDGRVYAMLPFHGADEPGVPDELYEMSAHETRLSTELWGCRWTEDRDLELTLFTYINFVDYQGVVPDVSVSLVEEHGGEALDLTVSHFDHVFANASVAHRFQDYRPGGCRVTVPVTVLARHARRLRKEGVEAPSWRLSVQVTARGLTRSGTISVVEPRGTAGGLGTAWLAPVAVEGLEVVAEPDPLTGLRISIADLPAVNLGSASVSGRVLTGRVESDLPVSGVVAWRPDGAPRVEAPVKDGSFVLDVPDVDYREGRTEARHWRLRALTGDGEHPIGWPLGSSERWYAASPDGQVALSRSTRGNCEIAETTRTMLLHDVRLHEKHLTVRGTWLGAVPDTWRLVLRGPRADLPADVALAADGEVNATIATDWDEWGVGSRPLATGTYRLVVLSGGPEPEIESVPVLADRLWERLLEEQVSNDHRLRLVKPARELRLVFEAPLPDDQRGAFAQTRLREAHGPDADLEVDPSAVYLQSYQGGSATDSQLAIAQELQRTRPDLRLYWGVADRSSRVPDGVTPLLMRTAEWFRLRATARYLVSNVDFDRGFQKRPGQRFLQTFHGYPSKSMGIRMWKGKRFTPSMIESELLRTSRDWDLILTPTPEMDQYYRREYRYDGPILSHGYPRDDVIVSSEATEVRQRTRERLGIAPEQTAVLYAPTWRDHLATSYRSAPAVRHLDLESASEALGEEYVFLLRGHRFHARTGARRRQRAARLLDVTSYPEVNDLILASDVAVLDYSSLRFDFALTNRPMVFLVPDLDVYSGGARGFLYDYRDTAPGPLLETADEVVEQLRDVEGIAGAHAEAYARFNATYNYLQDGTSAARVVAEFFDPPGIDG